MSKRYDGGVVYRTGVGRVCPECGQAIDGCVCKRRTEKQAPERADGVVRISRETKGRKGAGVTVVDGLGLATPAMQELAKSLKKKCGVGGSVKGPRLELQGDQRARLETELTLLGYRVKRSGG